ncbi:hypothetical protein [Azospirillum sp. sgz302134]
MFRAVPIAALALSLVSGAAHAADAPARQPVLPQPLQTPQPTNGIIMQAIQPSTTLVEQSQISSLLWIYDTNAKQLMLCAARTNREFDCSRAVRPNWSGQ